MILSWLGRRRVLASWVRNPSTSTRNRFVVAYRGLAGAVAGSCVARLLFTSCAAVNVNPRASRQPWRPGIAAAQGGSGWPRLHCIPLSATSPSGSGCAAPRRGEVSRRIGGAARRRPARLDLGCANLAHGFAACESSAKDDLRSDVKANVAIVSSYNDMLSAHQPYETFPRAIKEAVAAAGAVAQFAGGAPAMCDGVTQGHAGMELGAHRNS